MTVELRLQRVSIVAVCAPEQLSGVPALMQRQIISVLRSEVAFGTSERPKSLQIDPDPANICRTKAKTTF